MKTNTIILRLFTAALLALSAWSCSKEASVDPGRETPPSSEYIAGAYSFAIGGGHPTDENGTTRAILDVDESGAVRTYTYSWSPAPDNDEVGLIITPENTTVPFAGASNIRMTATNTQKAAKAVFRSSTDALTQNLFNVLSFEQNTQRYYSYYPYNASMSMSTFPVVQFRIPGTLTLTPNVLNPAYAPMVAEPRSDSRSVVFGERQIPALGSGELLEFTYEHVFAYVALELDVSLLGTTPTPITSIEMESVDMLLYGDYGYNMATNTRQSTGYTNGGFIITINIPGGLRPGSGDVVYVPIPAEAGVDAFKFKFRFPGTSYEDIEGVPGINFNRGNIHRLRLAPPMRYTQSSQFTVTTSGYYYIEAWGGNGGKGSNASRNGGSGGTGATVRGLYQFTEGDVISVQVGGAGTDGSGRTEGSAGTGSTLGNGGTGGTGGAAGHTAGAGGGGGGAASGILKNGTAVVVAGGGGGGGGGSATNLTGANGGVGGAGGSISPNPDDVVNANGANATGSTSGRNGQAGYGNGTGGANGGGGDRGLNNDGNTGGKGGNGEDADTRAVAGGAGGGGAGGGYVRGGGGGGGGDHGAAFSASGAGGGGAGGASYSIATSIYSGTGPGTIPANKTRPAPATTGDPYAGHVIITYVR